MEALLIIPVIVIVIMCMSWQKYIGPNSGYETECRASETEFLRLLWEENKKNCCPSCSCIHFTARTSMGKHSSYTYAVECCKCGFDIGNLQQATRYFKTGEL